MNYKTLDGHEVTTNDLVYWVTYIHGDLTIIRRHVEPSYRSSIETSYWTFDAAASAYRTQRMEVVDSFHQDAIDALEYAEDEVEDIEENIRILRKINEKS